MKPANLLGQSFGRLLVVKRVSNSSDGHTRWACRCRCGNTKVVSVNNLRGGSVSSCGCFQRESARAKHLKHGYRRHPLYGTWRQMVERCEEPTNENYRFYGARGIRVCSRWKSVAHFIADIGDRPPGMQLDRIDNDEGYRPGNVRWATALEQAQNRRLSQSSNRIAIHGVVRSAAAWAALLGLSRQAMYGRLRRGWSIEDAITTPPLRRDKCRNLIEGEIARLRKDIGQRDGRK